MESLALLALSDGELKPEARILLIVAGEWTEDSGCSSFSIGELHRSSGLGESFIRRGIKLLESSGYLRKCSAVTGKRGCPSRNYSFTERYNQILERHAVDELPPLIAGVAKVLDFKLKITKASSSPNDLDPQKNSAAHSNLVSRSIQSRFLSPSERLLLAVLMWYATPVGMVDSLGARDLQMKTGLSSIQLKGQLKWLVESRFILIKFPGQKGMSFFQWRKSLYILNLYHSFFADVCNRGRKDLAEKYGCSKSSNGFGVVLMIVSTENIAYRIIDCARRIEERKNYLQSEGGKSSGSSVEKLMQNYRLVPVSEFIDFSELFESDSLNFIGELTYRVMRLVDKVLVAGWDRLSPNYSGYDSEPFFQDIFVLAKLNIQYSIVEKKCHGQIDAVARFLVLQAIRFAYDIKIMLTYSGREHKPPTDIVTGFLYASNRYQGINFVINKKPK